MADTPKHEIEKLLSDYAKQRRDAAGTPEMHPATRNLLQAEVKQRYDSPDSAVVRTQKAWWKQLGPQIGFACFIVSALGVAIILIVSPGPKSGKELALAKMAEPSPASDNTTIPAAAPAPAATARREVMTKAGAPSPAPALTATPAVNDTRSVRKDADRLSDVKAKKEDSPASGGTRLAMVRNTSNTGLKDATKADLDTTAVNSPAAASTPSYAQKATGAVLADKPSDAIGRERPVSAPAKALTAAPPLTVAMKGGAAKAGESNPVSQQLISGQVAMNSTQVFRNVGYVQTEKTPPTPLMDEFKVEQNGSALTIVDRDGSVYNGYVHPAPATDQEQSQSIAGAQAYQAPGPRFGGGVGGRLTQPTASKTAAAPATPPAQNLTQAAQMQNVATLNYAFRVEGTNRSLNQRVVFTGNMLQTNPIDVTQNQNIAQNFNLQQQPTTQAFNRVVLESQAQNNFNNFINGRVQVGESKATVELNALSVGQ